jgi:hypothetical protein
MFEQASGHWQHPPPRASGVGTSAEAMIVTSHTSGSSKLDPVFPLATASLRRARSMLQFSSSERRLTSGAASHPSHHVSVERLDHQPRSSGIDRRDQDDARASGDISR